MKYQCETFRLIKSQLHEEAVRHAQRSQEHPNDYLARAHGGLAVSTKRYMARKLERHIRKCGLCA